MKYIQSLKIAKELTEWCHLYGDYTKCILIFHSDLPYHLIEQVNLIE